ncbi:MAG: alpha-N-arabinofuranosidase [Promethearchaeota archaeon]
MKNKNCLIKIDLRDKIGEISPYIYGHFAEHLGSCIYDGIWVGFDSKIPNINGLRLDVIEALRKIKPPVLRWPGGCFADSYYWRDGIGPYAQRPRRVNTWWHAEESNMFGTHEFLFFCKQIGAEPYIASNVGSGSPREMKEWLEYLNYNGNSTLKSLRTQNGHPEPFNVRFFGIGNENWGCGGNMSPRFYANLYKQFATYAESFSSDFNLYKIASGPASYNFYWTWQFFKHLCENRWIGCPYRLPLVNGFAMHYYCGSTGSATEYNEKEWFRLIKRARLIERLIKIHRWIMNRYDKYQKVDLIVDEWGTWHPPIKGTNPKWLRQINTIRDAHVAAHSLDIFNKNCKIVKMANIAQLINVLQTLIMTDGPKMHLTPNYYVFDLYKYHQGGICLNTKIHTSKRYNVPLISISCSYKFNSLDNQQLVSKRIHKHQNRNNNNNNNANLILTLTATNSSIKQPMQISLIIKGFILKFKENKSKKSKIYPNKLRLKSWKSLNTEDFLAFNSFEEPKRVYIKNMNLNEILFKYSNRNKDLKIKLDLPPCSINSIVFYC